MNLLSLSFFLSNSDVKPKPSGRCLQSSFGRLGSWNRSTATLLPNSGLAARCSKASNWEAKAGRKGSGFSQKACNLGRRRTHVPRPASKILLSHGSFQREDRESISKVGGQVLQHFPPADRPADFSSSSFGCCPAYDTCLQWDAVLPAWSTCTLAKGDAGSGESVII